MKKIATLLLALVMLLSFAACGLDLVPKDILPANETKSADSTQTQDDPVAAAPAPEGTREALGEASVPEMVAVDNDECTITITGVEEDSIWGYTVKLLLENKSADRTFVFTAENAAINGVECDPILYAEVTAGMKKNDELSISEDVFKDNGIKNYTDIELGFRVYDSDDWSADDVANETIHLYPYGEDKAETFVREAQPTDNVIVDNDNVTVIVTGYEDDPIWGYTVKLFLLNKTDKKIMFTADDVSVNGFMADPFFAATVYPGKCAFKELTWMDSTFEENGITTVEEIRMTFRAYDYDNWFGDDLANEAVTLNP